MSAMTADLRSELPPRTLSSKSVPNVAVRSMSRDLDKDIQRMTATLFAAFLGCQLLLSFDLHHE